jgi:uncharacterized protein
MASGPQPRFWEEHPLRPDRRTTPLCSIVDRYFPWPKERTIARPRDFLLEWDVRGNRLSKAVQFSAARRRGKFLFLVLAVVVFAMPAVAEPISSLKPTGYVNDFAGVLSAATQSQLNEMCRQVDRKAGAQIAVVTIKSTDGEDIFKYSVDLYQKWGIGQKGKDRGVLVLLSVQDRKYYINVGYGLEPLLPDGKVGGFGREAVPYLKKGDYDGAVSLLTSRVVDVIAKDAGVQITTSQPTPIASDEPAATQVSPGAIIGLIVLVIVVLSVPPLRRLLFYMFLFSVGGGGFRGVGGSGGGGGFGGGGGGFGGGGSFGGFGGGSTGGGGAGGSW